MYADSDSSFSKIQMRVFCLLAAAVCARAAPDADLVKGLPGWDGALPSKHYSGFLNASQYHVHYVFVEASTVAAADAPVRCLFPFRGPPNPAPPSHTSFPDINLLAAVRTCCGDRIAVAL